jgi:repressor LexA
MDYARFEALLHANNTTVYRVSKVTGIAPSTFSDWKNGRSTPKADKLRRIADFFGISTDSLLGTEQGEKNDLSGYLSVRAKKMVPILGEIRAGNPILTNEALIGTDFADVENSDEYFYLKVRGDSMRDIGIIEGALVLFHKQSYASDGDIVACLVGGDSATIKRFRQIKRQILLVPENDKYDPILLTTADFASGEARILGVATEVKIKL